jgi:8-oxo-dGTP pyrophosphatase MutT (NUDIX family)
MPQPRYTAVAILRVDGTFVLQHRDDKPTIPAPGHWSLFGGEIDPGETAPQAIRREIHEELGLLRDDWELLWRVHHYNPERGYDVHVNVFTADVSAEWPTHVLMEGQGLGLFTIDTLPAPVPPITIALLERYSASRC